MKEQTVDAFAVQTNKKHTRTCQTGQLCAGQTLSIECG
jgi:hypothetical protein